MNNGYREQMNRKHPLASKNGMVYEHRLAAERKLGRPLQAGEIVHHVDGNRANNAPENLWVFRTNADHVRFHAHGVFTLHSDGTVTAPVIPKYKCEVCGKKTDRASRCKEHRIIKTKIAWPSDEQLLDMIYRSSVTEAGRELGVSTAAIKHRLKRHGAWRPLRGAYNKSRTSPAGA